MIDNRLRSFKAARKGSGFVLALAAAALGLGAPVEAAVSYNNDPPMFWKEIDNPPS